MTIDANSPPAVSALADQLAAASSWTTAGGSSANIYYPDVTWTDSITLAAVLEQVSRSVAHPFVGVNLESGDLAITIYSTLTVPQLETLATSVANDVCTDLGLPNLVTNAVSEAFVPDEARAVSDSLNGITIDLSYGLEGS